MIVDPKKKGKKITPAVIDTVLGNLEGSIVDVVELRRKLNDDAVRCGRTTTTVGTTISHVPNRIEMGIHSQEGVTVESTSRHSPQTRNGCNDNNIGKQLSSGGSSFCI